MDLKPFYDKYGKDRVDQALELLNYKNPSVMPKQESEEYPTIYIFRHGQSEDNANFLFSGWRDAKLTEKGEKQALDLAEKLKDKKIQMLISSPQIRAVQTMRLAISKNETARVLDVHTDFRIRERCYGDLQGQSKLALQLENPELLKEYRRSYTKRANNGENLEDVIKRVTDFCNEIVPLAKENKINIAISCHGNSIRGFRKFFENLSVEEVCEMETPLAQDYLAYVIKN